LPQFSAPRTFDYARAVDGCRQMLWGFFKKMVIADNLAVIADKYYTDPIYKLETGEATGLQMAFATFCFAWQIYCDFSAYSDIAVGTAKLFGIQLMRNFAYPYFSRTIAEFWRRWHISLSTWFRDYLYIPLGGSRGGPIRKVVNVLITFTVSGLWHGASWNFVIWGALNGLGTLPQVLFPGKKRTGPADTPGGERLVPDPVTLMQIVGTFLFACLTWVFFRAKTFADAKAVLTSFVYPGPRSWAHYEFLQGIWEDERTFWTMVWLAVLVAAEWLQRRHWHPLVLAHWPRPLRWLLYTALIGVILYHGTHGQNAFIYFQF
jgi:D-alanyl-lipoteichoic acid acyltransferase DltB (MBOAT superfamily)